MRISLSVTPGVFCACNGSESVKRSPMSRLSPKTYLGVAFFVSLSVLKRGPVTELLSLLFSLVFGGCQCIEAEALRSSKRSRKGIPAWVPSENCEREVLLLHARAEHNKSYTGNQQGDRDCRRDLDSVLLIHGHFVGADLRH